DSADGISINELILAFWSHAEQHYRYPDGRSTNELSDYRLSLRPLKHLYGNTSAQKLCSNSSASAARCAAWRADRRGWVAGMGRCAGPAPIGWRGKGYAVPGNGLRHSRPKPS